MVISNGFVAQGLDPIFTIFIVAHCFSFVSICQDFQPRPLFTFITATSEIGTGPEALALIDGLQL